MSNKIRITVNGLDIETDNEAMLLDILKEQGIHVPHLCDHPSLPPTGACRLCMVEITKKEWGGKSKLVASCLYPAEEGLIVSTRSPEVLQIRRALLQLYLAEHPGSDLIKKLAGDEGIEATPFALDSGDNRCVMCGLCARVCQDLGPGAISTLYRGAEKVIGPNPEGVGVDCTGCRACAYICPTGAIPLRQEDGVLTIWNRSFEIPLCSVQPELCRGCGICEEVCPQAVPRVTLSPEGGALCHISPTACVGCGICAGSCPTGAIKQKKTGALDDLEQLRLSGSLENKTVLFVCPRSPMPAAAADELIMRVSCTGSVDIATILYCIAAGAGGAALLCRDRMSCPYR
ncbi:MAG: 4Fe-4S dicluster domain-containing protein [Firmicutes bacterium]|nr:4Fe-4S dicluster domain-containing protein [Bacillota bacterium]